MQAAPPVDDHISSLASQLKDAYDLRISDLTQSILLTQKLLNQFSEEGHFHLVAKAKNHLGLFYLIRGEFVVAKKYSMEALDYFEEIHDEQGVADAKYNIGSIYY